MSEKELIEQEVTDAIASVMLAATMVALKKEFGFGKQRLERAMISICSEIEAIGQTVDVDEYVNNVEELTGVKVNI